MEAPKCPVCVQPMTVPIFQCQTGHSLCNLCTTKLSTPLCPLCRQTMTQMRNWQLEDLVAQAVVPCSNKNKGCIIKVALKDMEDHLKECKFRMMDCPLGKTFGTCSWSGKQNDLMKHFKENHPQNCDINITSDISIKNITICSDFRQLYLFQFNKQTFILSFKIDTVQNQAYWLVQYVGTKQNARKNIYEIHITSPQSEKRKVVFADHCFSDSMDPKDVFRQSKCATMPLKMLTHFVVNSTIVFRCFIKYAQGELKPALENKFINKDTASSQGPSHNRPKSNMNKGKHFKPKSNQNEN